MTATTRCASRPSRAFLSRACLAAERTGPYDTETNDHRATDAPAPTDADPTPGTADGPDDISALVDALAALATTAALDRLDEQALRTAVTHAARLSGIATALLAGATTRLQDAGALRRDGASSAAAWLAIRTGTTYRTAGRTMRIGRQLDHMPATARRLAAGDLTVEAADTLARTADDGTLGPAHTIDATFADAATRLPPEKLRARIRRRQQAADATAIAKDDTQAHQRRQLVVTPQDSGMVSITGQVTSVVGDMLRTALDALNPPDPDHTPDDEKRTRPQRLADALEELLRRQLASRDTPQVAGRVPQLSVVVDLKTLATDLSRPDGSAPAPTDPVWRDLPVAETTWGLQLAPQTVRAIACDAAVSRIVFNGSAEPLDVGRATRVWPTAIRTAALARDRGCRGPGCDRPIAWTQLHHLLWWRNGGDTSIHNALSLCKPCHDLIHHHGWTAHLDHDTARVTWTAPDGTKVLAEPRC